MADEIDDEEITYLESAEKRCLACDDLIKDGNLLICEECLGIDNYSDEMDNFNKQVLNLKEECSQSQK